jgi:hypothetical protein
MTDKSRNGSAERDLWRRHRPLPESAEPISGFDANLIAAWLEDNLTDEDWPALEARLAAKPAEIETLRAAATLQHGTAEALPPALRAKLLALAPTQVRKARRAPAGRFPNWRVAEWAMAAAVLVAVAVAGFDLGSTTSADSAQVLASAGDSAASYQVALDTYLPTSSVSFLVEGDGR